MSFSNANIVKATRKDHVCEGCGQMIPKGERAWRWAGTNAEGDFGHAVLHPECREAEFSYNQTFGSGWGAWWSLQDLERDDEPWLREEFPAVADRVFGRKEAAHG